MEPIDNKDVKLTQTSRRKFLVTASAASVPLMMSFKSRATWGSSSLNCGLSATASQIASVTANTGEQCLESKVRDICIIDYFGRNGYFKSNARREYKFNGVAVNQNTKFNKIFPGGSNATLKQCTNRSDTDFERNISYCFLYAFYLQQVRRRLGDFPSPDHFVDAYVTTNGQKRADLERLVAFYAAA